MHQSPQCPDPIPIGAGYCATLVVIPLWMYGDVFVLRNADLGQRNAYFHLKATNLKSWGDTECESCLDDMPWPPYLHRVSGSS